MHFEVISDTYKKALLNLKESGLVARPPANKIVLEGTPYSVQYSEGIYQISESGKKLLTSIEADKKTHERLDMESETILEESEAEIEAMYKKIFPKLYTGWDQIS